MIKISTEERYIKYEKCISCSSKENLKAIIITNDYTNKDNVIIVCNECLNKYIKNKED